jgi:S-DNA-T family DNA segregation ATPase FtsK/SpoIIIE
VTLHCTLVRGPGSGLADAPVELTISAGDGCPGSELDCELSLGFGTRLLTVDGLPLTSLTVGQAPLVNGAVLVDGAQEARRPRSLTAEEVPAALLLAVHSGPGAGRVLPLRRGSYRIGRTNTELTIPDADLSREHARIDVSDTALTIEDLDSANGTEVDGTRVRNAVISTSSLIRCGNSTLSVVVASSSGSRNSGLSSAGLSVAEPLTVPLPAGQENRTTLFLSAGLPLLVGVGLALLTGMWMFLAFTAVSAVTLLVPVITGRRQRRELRSAVAAASARDKERRRRSAPSAAQLALDVAGFGKHDDVRPDAAGIWLRLGLAEQVANVRLEPADPEFRPPPLGRVPLLLDPGIPVVSIRGPDTDVRGLMQSFVMQLTGYPLARGTRIAVYGPVSALPLAARYLPAVTLHAATDEIEVVLAGSRLDEGAAGILLVTGNTGTKCPDQVVETALRHGWRVIRFTDSGAGPSGTDIELGERQAWLRSPGATQIFVADLVPHDVFDRYCRQFGPATGGGTAARPSVPAACPLSDILDPSTAATARRWARGRLAPGLAIPIGLGTGGPRVLDLEADGPHVLVAGTTGSGKSELLRSLTVALALSYPPDRVNVLFFDFKGGSGLGPMTSLPHCVGMLTDLTRSELDRTMASLRAEVRRREQLLASVQAPDLRAYRQSGTPDLPPLPQLVLIIDEFRMLVEDAPESLNELMRIATIGRSLGVHLIMATQRPQGALTADIRANVTTSIALRVQFAHESADIIGTNAAAAISVAAPGRAYLARGTEAPEEFQAAALSLSSSPDLRQGRVRVRRTSDELERSASLTTDRGGPAQLPTPAAAVGPLIESTRSLWTATGGAVRSPVAPPLPDAPTYARTGSDISFGPSSADTRSASSAVPASSDPQDEGCCVELGWIDLPHEQRVARLWWRPANDGHLALIGGTSGDATGVMSLALGQIATHPAESHLYVLDADGSLSGLVSSSRAGAVVGLHELRRGVRVLERLGSEMSRRLSGAATAQATPLVLAISGWGSWVSAMRASPLTWAEDLVQDIVRDGHRAAITVLISGDRELVTSRFMSAVPNRAYFPRGASEESRFAWPKMPEVPAIPGRAVVFGSMSGSHPAVCQFHARDGQCGIAGAAQAPLRSIPFRVEPLPAQVPLANLLTLIDRTHSVPAPDALHPADTADKRGHRNRQLYIGVGGDELSPVTVRLPAGGVLAVLGGTGSGKTSLLGALPALNPSAAGWLCPDPEASAADSWARIHREAVQGRLARDAVLLVDDADLLPASANQQLLELNTLGWAVVLSAGFGQALVQRVPLAMAARNHGSGILIAPRSPMDGDLFGIRFELEPNPPPGRAVLLAHGRATPVQLARSQPGALTTQTQDRPAPSPAEAKPR